MATLATACGGGSAAPDGGATPDAPSPDAPRPDAPAPDGQPPADAAPACPAPTSGPTLHQGFVTADEVWTADGSPHQVVGTVSIRQAATVAIEACAEVRLAAGTAILLDDGTAARLVAVGDAGRPIAFRAEGPGAWGQIRAVAPAFVTLAHASVDGGGAGGFSTQAALVAWGAGALPLTASLSLDHVIVSDSSGAGLEVARFGAVADGSTALAITGSGGAAAPFPVRIQAQSLASLPDGVYTGNLDDHVLVTTEGGITEDVAVHDRGIPYRISSAAGPSLQVAGAATPTLTLEPGVDLRFESGASLDIGHAGFPGALLAVGTAERPIRFDSAAAVPAPGDWAGIELDALASDNPSRIARAAIEHAGADCSCSGFTCAPTTADPENGAVLILGWRPDSAFITDTAFAQIAGHGVVRGWTSAAPGPDFTPTNSFTGVSGCAQTDPKLGTNLCPAAPECNPE